MRKTLNSMFQKEPRNWKKSFKKTSSCNQEGCKYKIIFQSDDGTQYKIYPKLSKKYTQHSKCYNFYEFILLDHKLSYEKKSIFNELILEEINLLKGKVKTYKELTKIINKKFSTEFQMAQIKYQAMKFLKETYGDPDKDAYKFVELAKEAAKDGGYFKHSTNSSQELFRMIYLSKTMQIYSNYFLDLVIVDSTYRRNRFNLPLINVIGINNLGQNIMLAFGLLSNETNEAYEWFFSQLKSAWGKNKPLNFIIDGCEEMKKSFILFYHWFIVFRNFEAF